MTRRLVALALLAVGVYALGFVTTRAGLLPAPWAAVRGQDLVGEPQIGVAYNVVVGTHCGLRYVNFDGSGWTISGDLGRGGPPGNGWGDPDHGTVTLITRDTALYHNEWGEQRSLTRLTSGLELSGPTGCL